MSSIVDSTGSFEQSTHKILIVDDERPILVMLQEYLEQAGYYTLAAASGLEALDMAKREGPHLILLDVMMPGKDGFEVCRELRNGIRTFHIPIIMLTARSQTSDKIRGLNAGADDYVTKPFDFEELMARIEAQLRNMERGLLSELTNLPGNTLIERAIKQIVKVPQEPWAVAYVDLDNFKAYNDIYGFVAGNEMIKAIARIIREAVDELGDPNGNDFVGHIGGDDFVIVSAPESIEMIIRRVIEQADSVIPSLYSAEHQERGFVVTTDRQGRVARFPLVTVSAGIVTNRFKVFSTHWQVARTAAEVKNKAKAIRGSAYYVDQRR